MRTSNSLLPSQLSSIFYMASARSMEGAALPIHSLIVQATSQLKRNVRLNLIRQSVELNPRSYKPLLDA